MKLIYVRPFIGRGYTYVTPFITIGSGPILYETIYSFAGGFSDCWFPLTVISVSPKDGLGIFGICEAYSLHTRKVIWMNYTPNFGMSPYETEREVGNVDSKVQAGEAEMPKKKVEGF